MPLVLRVQPNGMATMQMLLVLMGMRTLLLAISLELVLKSLVLTILTVRPRLMIPLGRIPLMPTL